MTGSSVYTDYSEWRAVYTAPGGDYNAHRIAYICQIATEIRYVGYLYLYMNNRKII
jgi:outer membrane protease